MPNECNHLGFGHELCNQCGAVTKCAGCGDKIRFDFWNTAFEDKLNFLVKREKELEIRETQLADKEAKIKKLIDNLHA